MKHLKLFENFEMNEKNYNISDKLYKAGHFGVEFDEWYDGCNEKAKEKNWNNWEFQFISKDKDPEQKKVFFVVTVKQFDSKNAVIKGTFNLRNKVSEILD